MATLAFVLFWVILGIGLLLFALRRARHERAAGPGRTTHGFYTAGVVLSLLVLGVAIPTAVAVSIHNRDDIPDANVSDLTAQEQHGRELFAQRCRNCHTLAAVNAVAMVGPNLDQLAPPPALIQDAIENGRARGNGQMAADLVEGEDAEAVVAFVSKAVGTNEQQ